MAKYSCSITGLKIIEHRSKKGGTTYRLAARYTYSVDGVTYDGNRVDFTTSTDPDRDGWLELQQQLQSAQSRRSNVLLQSG